MNRYLVPSILRAVLKTNFFITLITEQILQRNVKKINSEQNTYETQYKSSKQRKESGIEMALTVFLVKQHYNGKCMSEDEIYYIKCTYC